MVRKCLDGIKILDGKGLAQIAEQEIKNKVSELKDKGVTPTLATVLVGVDPASATYVKMKTECMLKTWHGIYSY